MSNDCGGACQATVDTLHRVLDILGVGQHSHTGCDATTGGMDESFELESESESAGAGGRRPKLSCVQRLSQQALAAVEDLVHGLEVAKREQSILSTALEVFAGQVSPVVNAALPLLVFHDSEDGDSQHDSHRRSHHHQHSRGKKKHAPRDAAAWRPPTAGEVIEWAQRAVGGRRNAGDDGDNESDPLPAPTWMTPTMKAPAKIESWVSSSLLSELSRINEMLHLFPTPEAGGRGTAGESARSSSFGPSTGLRAQVEDLISSISQRAREVVGQNSSIQDEFAKLHKSLSQEMQSLSDAVCSYKLQQQQQQQQHRQQGGREGETDPAASHVVDHDLSPVQTLQKARSIVIDASLQLASSSSSSATSPPPPPSSSTGHRHHATGGGGRVEDAAAAAAGLQPSPTDCHTNSYIASGPALDKAARSRRQAHVEILQAEREEFEGRVSLLHGEAVALVAQVNGKNQSYLIGHHDCYCDNNNNNNNHHDHHHHHHHQHQSSAKNNNNNTSGTTHRSNSGATHGKSSTAQHHSENASINNSSSSVAAINTNKQISVREQLFQIGDALGVAAIAVSDRKKAFKVVDTLRSEVMDRERRIAMRLHNWANEIQLTGQKLLSSCSSGGAGGGGTGVGGAVTTSNRLGSAPSALTSNLHPSSTTTTTGGGGGGTGAGFASVDSECSAVEKALLALDAACAQSATYFRNQRMRLDNLIDDHRNRSKHLKSLAQVIRLLCEDQVALKQSDNQQQASPLCAHNDDQSTTDRRNLMTVDSMVKQLTALRERGLLSLTRKDAHHHDDDVDAAATDAPLSSSPSNAAPNSETKRETTTTATTTTTTPTSADELHEQQQQQQQQEFSILQRQFGLMCETMRSLILQLDPDNEQLDDERLDEGALTALGKFKTGLGKLITALTATHESISGEKGLPFEVLDGFLSDSLESASRLADEVCRIIQLSPARARRMLLMTKRNSPPPPPQGAVLQDVGDDDVDDDDDDAEKAAGSKFDAIRSERFRSQVFASPPRDTLATQTAVTTDIEPAGSRERGGGGGGIGGPVAAANRDADLIQQQLRLVGELLHDTFRSLAAGTQIKYLQHGSDMVEAASIAEREFMIINTKHRDSTVGEPSSSSSSCSTSTLTSAAGSIPAETGLFEFLQTDEKKSQNSSSSNNNYSSAGNDRCHHPSLNYQSLEYFLTQMEFAARQVSRLSQSFTKGLKLAAILIQKDVDAAQTHLAHMLRTSLRMDVNKLGCSREQVLELRSICDPTQRHEQRGRYFFFNTSQASSSSSSGSDQQHHHPVVFAVKSLEKVFEQVTSSCFEWKKRAEESDQLLDSIAFNVCSRISANNNNTTNNSSINDDDNQTTNKFNHHDSAGDTSVSATLCHAKNDHWSRNLTEEEIQQDLPNIVDRLAGDSFNSVPLKKAEQLRAQAKEMKNRMIKLEIERDTAESEAAVARATLQQQQQQQQQHQQHQQSHSAVLSSPLNRSPTLLLGPSCESDPCEDRAEHLHHDHQQQQQLIEAGEQQRIKSKDPKKLLSSKNANTSREKRNPTFFARKTAGMQTSHGDPARKVSLSEIFGRK